MGSAQVYVVDDGEKTIRFFEQADAEWIAPCPDLILLDINTPRYKGGEILRRLRAGLRRSLVLNITSSDSQDDRNEMETLSAYGYFRKLSEFAEFIMLGDLIRDPLQRNPTQPA